MRNWIRVAWMTVAWAVLSAAAAAQTLTVPKVLTAGRSVTIRYSDPSRAGETVTVDIDNAGYPAAIELELQITLDDEGNGSAEWIVPLWMVANFNAPGVDEETRDIDLVELPIF